MVVVHKQFALVWHHEEALLSARTDSGKQVLPAGAVVMAVGINGLKKIAAGTTVLSKRPEFQRLSNLRSVDVLAGVSFARQPS